MNLEIRGCKADLRPRHAQTHAAHVSQPALEKAFAPSS